MHRPFSDTVVTVRPFSSVCEVTARAVEDLPDEDDDELTDEDDRAPCPDVAALALAEDWS